LRSESRGTTAATCSPASVVSLEPQSWPAARRFEVAPKRRLSSRISGSGSLNLAKPGRRGVSNEPRVDLLNNNDHGVAVAPPLQLRRTEGRGARHGGAGRSSWRRARRERNGRGDYRQAPQFGALRWLQNAHGIGAADNDRHGVAAARALPPPWWPGGAARAARRPPDARVHTPHFSALPWRRSATTR
jgi:hypothetical protein